LCVRKRAANRPLSVAGRTFERGSAGAAEIDVGEGLGGTRLVVPVRVVAGARPGPRLALIAGLRGDEVSAIEAVREAAARVAPDRLTGDLLAVPLANVAGFVDARRPVRGALERSFPGDPQGSAAARMAHAVFQAVVRKADLLVVLGAWRAGRHALPHVRTDIDAPGALPLAVGFGAPLVVHERGLGGTLVRAALAEGRAAILYHVGVARQLARDAVDGAVEAIVRLLREFAMLRGLSPRRPRPTVVRRVEELRAQAGGLVELRVKPGHFARLGEPLCEIVSPWSDERRLETAPFPGLVIATTARAVVQPGMALAWIGRDATRPPPPSTRSQSPRTLVGWSEWVALPDLGVPRLKAKIDTGARTCALHVTAWRRVGEDGRGRPLVEIEVPTGARARARGGPVRARAAVVEMVTVRDSGGTAQRRPVIETTLAIGPVQRRVRVTLTDRGEMLFPMLIGRTGLGSDFLVDVGARYLLSKRRPG